MNFRNRFGLTVVVNLFLAGVSFGTSIMAARFLGAQGRGELTAIWIYPMLLSNLALLGLPEALVFFTARSPTQAGRLLSTCILTGLALSFPILMVMNYLLPSLLSAQSQAIIQYARLFLWFIPINAFTGFIGLSLRGKNDLGYWNLTRVIPPLLWFSLLGLQYFRGQTSSAGELSNQYLLWLFISGFVVMMVGVKRLQGPFRPDFKTLSPMIKYGIPAMLGSIPAILNLRLDQMVMAGFISPEKLGFYVTAVGYSGIALSVTGALAAMVVPDIAGIVDENEKKSKMARSFRLGSGLASIMVIALAISAAWIIPVIYGSEFSPVIPVAILLCLASGIAGLNAILENGLLGLGYPGLVFMAELCGLIATGVLLLLLLKPWQLFGAAVASISSYTVVLLVLVGLLSKKTSMTLKEMIIPSRKDIEDLFRRKAPCR
jgi:O-antigen/teichoic acid export membrane protein